MEYKAGQWVRVTANAAADYVGRVFRVVGAGDSYGPALDFGGGYINHTCSSNVEPWTPRLGERVRVLPAYEVRGADANAAGEFVVGVVTPGGIGAAGTGRDTHRDISALAPVLNAEGFPLGALPETAEAAPAAPPPTAAPSLACACGAPLTESFFSRACERGHVGVDTYRRVETRPVVELVRYARPLKPGPNKEGRPLQVFEPAWRASGEGRSAVHATESGAIAAWKAAR